MKNTCEFTYEFDINFSLTCCHMNIEFFRDLNNDELLKWFPRKPFGLELMLLLEQLEEQDSGNGIDDTWLLIQHNRPQRGTFSLYVNELDDAGVIDIHRSKDKRSRKIMRLSKASISALNRIRKNHLTLN
tara:strand:+ start:316 stop:705 length:390 start_codon:yes stop_codon:yes gene_type:complete